MKMWFVGVVVAVVVLAAVFPAMLIVFMGGGGSNGLPVYPGATENKEAGTLLEQHLFGNGLIQQWFENQGLARPEVAVYSSTDNVSIVHNWYDVEMQKYEWTKENEFSSYSNYASIYKRGDNGAYITVFTILEGTATISVISGQWKSVAAVYPGGTSQ